MLKPVFSLVIFVVKWSIVLHHLVVVSLKARIIDAGYWVWEKVAGQDSKIPEYADSQAQHVANNSYHGPLTSAEFIRMLDKRLRNRVKVCIDDY